MMMKKENLFGDHSEEIKKTCKKLNEFGLPSLMERWHTDPSKYNDNMCGVFNHVDQRGMYFAYLPLPATLISLSHQVPPPIHRKSHHSKGTIMGS